jgi:hypothetical protein
MSKSKYLFKIIDPDGNTVATGIRESHENIYQNLVLPFLKSLEPDVECSWDELVKNGYAVVHT